MDDTLNVAYEQVTDGPLEYMKDSWDDWSLNGYTTWK